MSLIEATGKILSAMMGLFVNCFWKSKDEEFILSQRFFFLIRNYY